VKYEDLPAAARAQVDAQLGRKSKPKERGATEGGPCPYLCKACSEESPTWPKAQAHARAEGHVRQEMVLA
jgi:hypothetical protein